MKINCVFYLNFLKKKIELNYNDIKLSVQGY